MRTLYIDQFKSMVTIKRNGLSIISPPKFYEVLRYLRPYSSRVVVACIGSLANVVATLAKEHETETHDVATFPIIGRDECEPYYKLYTQHKARAYNDREHNTGAARIKRSSKKHKRR